MKDEEKLIEFVNEWIEEELQKLKVAMDFQPDLAPKFRTRVGMLKEFKDLKFKTKSEKKEYIT